MQLTAKLIQILPLQTGTGRNGEWRKQDIIVEIEGGQFPRKVCVAIWGDKINPSILEIGNTLTIDFDIESREFNGRWYTDVKAWKIQAASMPQSGGVPIPPPPPPTENDPIGTAPLPADFSASGDDLPF
ncbi:hypothetical protein MASR1M31_08310 [Porphyromonadaceae bacterium]